MIDWLWRSIKVLADYADYVHCAWAQPQMCVKHPDYMMVCRKVYEYRRTYGWS